MSAIQFFRRALLVSVVFSFIFTLSNCREDEPTPSGLGQLDISPSEIIVNTNALINAHVHVAPGVQISGESLNLTVYKISANGQQTEVGTLADDGNLYYNGDEIKGDNIYSGMIYVTETNPGTIELIAKGEMLNSKGEAVSAESAKATITVYADIDGADMKALFDVQNDMVTQLNTYLGGNQNNAPNAVTQLLQWVQNQPEVEWATMDNGSSSIEIRYKSGLMGGAVVSLEDDNGYVDTRGGFALTSGIQEDNNRGNTAKIPVSQQTRGKNYSGIASGKTIEDFDPNLIGNRNVFIYAPFEASWKNNERPHIINILDSIQCGDFKITTYVNQEATVARIAEMMTYGMVVLSTHGSGGGKALLTGEIADTTLDAYQTYKPLLQGASPKMGISKNMTISKQGAVVNKGDVYKLYAAYISDLAGTFPQSVILANFCGSDQTPPLKDAFIGKGAKTYFGYTETVNGGFCVAVARDVFTTLAKDRKKTGEVSKINTSDPQAPNATLKIEGSADMRYAFELVNGNFEKGMLGWTKAGDGRVISQLGSLDTGEGLYMGIISTGLGYTTETGSISQTFTVPNNANTLDLEWNFLSEEFCEYIGSSYQDWFEVVLKSEEFGVETLLSRSVDGIAAEFEATGPTEDDPEGLPGNLTGVSPDVVFDQGGVFMTGWQSESFDISSYRNKCVTLTLRSSDVGDSIYDTAILLDDVAIK